MVVKRSGLRPGRAGMSPRVRPAREWSGNVDATEMSAMRAFRRLQELRFTRFREALPYAGLHQPGRGHVLRVRFIPSAP